MGRGQLRVSPCCGAIVAAIREVLSALRLRTNGTAERTPTANGCVDGSLPWRRRKAKGSPIQTSKQTGIVQANHL